MRGGHPGADGDAMSAPTWIEITLLMVLAFIAGACAGWELYWPLNRRWHEEDWNVKRITEEMVRRNRSRP